MFSELFTLVKVNAGMAVIDNPLIPQQYHEAVINEAASSIIEGMKCQFETGRLKDVVKYFEHPHIYQSPLVNQITRKFAGKLNKYYGLADTDALQASRELIPVVMQQMVERTRDEHNQAWNLNAIFTWIAGYQINIADFMQKMRLV